MDLAMSADGAGPSTDLGSVPASLALPNTTFSNAPNFDSAESEVISGVAAAGPGATLLMLTNREVRRTSDPSRAQQLWDAIGAVRAQKQIPAITRMARYMNRFYQVNKEETQRLLDAAVEDNLIKLERKVGTKGHKSGVEEKAYRLPTPDMLPRERHDWYCFHCHAGGEVLLCAGCHKVFHESCLKGESNSAVATEKIEDDDREDWYCITCRLVQKTPESNNKKERKDLNHLLRVACNKLKPKLPPNVMAREVPKQPNKGAMESLSPQHSPHVLVTAKEERWRSSFLLKQETSLNEIESKCLANQYRVPEEFRSDVQLIVHNIVIFHGAHSNLADLAKQMLRDCISDLREILQCRDCFRYANEMREKYWFCKPCRPFHELVYAKQKGFPYWPAKVISSSKSMHVVRFFGGYHQKTTIEKQYIQPITVNVHTLQVKRTSLWNKACEELKKHQELLTKCQADDNFLKDPFGDPFADTEIAKEFAKTAGHDRDDDNEDGHSDDNSDAETRAKQQALLAKAAAQIPSPSKKSKKGRPKTKKEESEDFVSSSSQDSRFTNAAVQTSSKMLKKADTERGAKSPPENLRAVVEKMRADFEQEKKRAVNVATRSLERDLERLKADHATEIEEMAESHKKEISELKKKQWCYFCEEEAIYWCCWNTSYCSTDCQVQHWHKEHKRSCRRNER